MNDINLALMQKKEIFNFVPNLALDEEFVEEHSAEQDPVFTLFSIAQISGNYEAFEDTEPLLRCTNGSIRLDVLSFKCLSTPEGKLYILACRTLSSTGEKRYYTLPIQALWHTGQMPIFRCEVNYNCHYVPVPGEDTEAFLHNYLLYCLSQHLKKCIKTSMQISTADYVGVMGDNTFSATIQVTSDCTFRISVTDKTNSIQPRHNVLIAPRESTGKDFRDWLSKAKQESIDSDCQFTLYS